MKRQMFAFADEDETGQINPLQFAKAWGSLKTTITSSVSSQLGLSDGDVLWALVFAAAVFALTIPFILLVRALWTANNDSLAAAFTSLVIAGSGVLAQSPRTKMQASMEADPAAVSKSIEKAVRVALQFLKPV